MPTSNSNQLRLAFLLPFFPVLSNTFVIEQVKGMIERGHQVDVFARTQKSMEDLPPDLQHLDLEQRMRHLRIPKGRLARLASAARILGGLKGLGRAHLDALNAFKHGRSVFKLVRLHTAASFVRSGPYDVLHCHYGNWGILGERLVRTGATDAALVTSFRGADLSSHYPAHPERFRALFERGDLHLPVSADFRARLIKAGVSTERVEVHHDGIDTRQFAFAPRRSMDGPVRLLFVGRLTEKKGVAYGLEAVAGLVRAGRDVELKIIGDGPLVPSLKALSAQLELDEHVVFEGSRSNAEVAHAMAESHILIAPSVTAANGDQEGIPTVLKEAMATGMPVVSTRHSGIPELVDHGITGFLVAERDASELTAHLIRLIDNPGIWGTMGRAARRKVEDEFDTEKLNDMLVERYREAIAGKARRSRAR